MKSVYLQTDLYTWNGFHMFVNHSVSLWGIWGGLLWAICEWKPIGKRFVLETFPSDHQSHTSSSTSHLRLSDYFSLLYVYIYVFDWLTSFFFFTNSEQATLLKNVDSCHYWQKISRSESHSSQITWPLAYHLSEIHCLPLIKKQLSVSASHLVLFCRGFQQQSYYVRPKPLFVVFCFSHIFHCPNWSFMNSHNYEHAGNIIYIEQKQT